jgi:hypothetical protein
MLFELPNSLMSLLAEYLPIILVLLSVVMCVCCIVFAILE